MKFPIIMLACFCIAILAVGSAGETITNAIDEENKIKVPGKMRDLQAGIPVNPPRDDDSGTKLVLLGTTGGVTGYPGVDSTNSSSALLVGDTLYIIDLGQGSTSRLAQAFNTEKSDTGISTFLENARALFFSHPSPRIILLIIPPCS